MSEPLAGKIDPRRLSILWAGADHAAELARLHAELFDQPWTIESLHELLAHPGSAAFLARVGDPPETAGFIVGRIAADEAEILTLCVREKWQRRGVGRRLVEAVIRAAKKAEARQLFLEVAASNGPAIALYKGLGFGEIGARKSYYDRSQRPAEDALMLARPL